MEHPKKKKKASDEIQLMLKTFKKDIKSPRRNQSSKCGDRPVAA